MDTNPYQPPRHNTVDTVEQKFAKRLLLYRDKPVTIASLYRSEGTLKRLAIVVIYFVLATAFFAWMNFYGPAYLMIGILVGALSSGFGIVRKSVKVWPINRQVIDWDKVERMARGEFLDVSNSDRPNSAPVVS
jgi:hypothetical protein